MYENGCSISTTSANEKRTKQNKLYGAKYEEEHRSLDLILSTCSATIFAYLGEFHCQKDRSHAMLGIIAWIFINQDFEVYVPYINIVFKPWRSYFLACGVPGFICGLAMFFLPESPKYLLSAGKPEEPIEVLKCMHRLNFGSKEPENTYSITTLLLDADTPMTKVKSLEN